MCRSQRAGRRPWQSLARRDEQIQRKHHVHAPSVQFARRGSPVRTRLACGSRHGVAFCCCPRANRALSQASHSQLRRQHRTRLAMQCMHMGLGGGSASRNDRRLVGPRRCLDPDFAGDCDRLDTAPAGMDRLFGPLRPAADPGRPGPPASGACRGRVRAAHALHLLALLCHPRRGHQALLRMRPLLRGH